MDAGRPGLFVARGEKSTTFVPGVPVGETGAGSEVGEYVLGSTRTVDASDRESCHVESEHF